MKRDEVFPSKYLKATDLNGKALRVTIERAPLEILKNPEGKEQSKTVLHFVMTEMAGKRVACIRVRAPEQRELPTANPKKAAKNPAAQSLSDEMDDEIPFE